MGYEYQIEEWCGSNILKDDLFSETGKSMQPFNPNDCWSDLMPVVEKITRHVYDEEEVCDGLGGKRIAKYTAYLRTFGMLSSEGKQMVRFNRSPLFEADTLIDATYQAVVDWIHWYNSTQNKEKV